MKPIIPFEPISSTKIPNEKEWIYQIKWDGVRILTYFDGKEINLRNRKQNERTHHFPELIDLPSYCNAKSVILDGEVIALNKHGHPSFREVMRRDAIRRMDRVQHMINEVPVYYMVFDIVYLNGKWVNLLPLTERIEILASIIKPNNHVQLTTSHDDGNTLFDVTKEKGMEGILAKKLTSSYKLGGKDEAWLKIKNFQDVIAVIGGVTYRNGIVNAVLLGLYDQDGHLHYIGHAGTGKLSVSDWRTITDFVEPLIMETRPFINEPERRKNTKWLQPKLTVKIQFIEWPKGGSIRQPSIQAFVNVPPEECRLTNK
ncbi:RNA ligase family protein [Evansella sp. AB-P1]|uniref:ATP-dependent DNA ligase n=1 Tax=Evansella sp. AB-P1 TaxID=3037653 RepID=UPI00241CA069|nr:RNA ligase family protein [Evansella sp. AB-P1]MDG5786949.1 RNA ligase family protein [Evansella sp. AB-P1]